MVNVKGSSGKIVNVQILGLSETIRMLRAAGHNIKFGGDSGVIKAGVFIAEEVKEAIAGNRPNISVKSVDTGLLANSIQFQKISDGVGVVKSNPTSYPDSNVTTADVAVFMEYGTSKNPVPRLHFTNTANNGTNIDAVKEIIQSEIKNAAGILTRSDISIKGKTWKSWKVA